MPLDRLFANPIQLAAAIATSTLLLALLLLVLLLPRAGGRSLLRQRVQSLAGGRAGVRSGGAPSRGSGKNRKLVQGNLKELAAGKPQGARRVKIRQLIVQAALSWSMTVF